VQDGDVITFDVAARRLDVDAELTTRTCSVRKHAYTRGVIGKYAALVASASEGAVTRPPSPTRKEPS